MNIPTDATEIICGDCPKQPRLFLIWKASIMRTIIVPRKLVNIVVK